MRKCGYCGKPGHNRRTCPKLKADKEAELEEEVVVTKKPKKKRKQRCRACGEEDDHTAKNCPYKPLPEGTEVGPRRMECGCWSWWLRDGKCDLCSGEVFLRQLDDEQQEAA